MSFTDDWKAESEAAINAIRETQKVMAIEVFSGVISRTPVGNVDLWLYNHPERGYIDYLSWYDKAPDGYTGGSARAGWFLTFNEPSNRLPKSKSPGEKKKGAVTRTLEARGFEDKYILTNNLPYIERLDENWSTQTDGLGILNPEISRVNAMKPKIEAAANKKYGV